MSEPHQQLLEAFVGAVRGTHDQWAGMDTNTALGRPEARAILEAAPETRAAVALLVVQELCPPARTLGKLARGLGVRRARDYLTLQLLQALLSRLLRARLPFSEPQVLEIVEALRRTKPLQFPMSGPLRVVERHVAEHGLSPALQQALAQLRQALQPTKVRYSYAETRKAHARVEALLAGDGGGGPPPVQPGVWGDDVLAWLETLDERAPWDALLTHAAAAASKSRPSQKWQRRAEELVRRVGPNLFAERLGCWLERARLGWTAQPQWGPRVELGMSEHNQDLLKGLLWAAASLHDPGLAHAVGTFGERCYRKIKDFGPASKKLGNACLFTLSALPDGLGVAHLSRLAGKVRYASGRTQVERALNQAAERAGQSREDIEELAVPDFGLDREGQRRETLGDHTALLSITPAGEVTLSWIKPGGKRQKSVPKAVREQHPDRLKEIKRQHKALKELLSGQSGRLQRMWLLDRRLPLSALRQRYLEHPVVGQLARRLLWLVQDGERPVEVLWRHGKLVTLGGEPVELSDDAEARLWHILDLDTDDEAQLQRLLVWREYLEELQIQQPFKQLWREVYRPRRDDDDADRRFAGHIVRQHPFLNLCQQRGWQYTIQGYWDSHNLPTRTLERWGITAVLELDPVDHKRDDFIFNYLVTGGLRFHATGDGVIWDHPVAVGQVPPIVFSELMRDVDLFVGVSTVANDPSFTAAEIKQSWRQYWTDAAWGELAPVAETRRRVLEGVLPRTTLRDRAALEDRWLVVRGPSASYRVHLGTANVRREDSDLALDVVPDRRAKNHVAAVFLPFEGDSMLATILAKAFMLVEQPAR